MADFRRWFTVLAVLAVMACAASAQVGVAVTGGSANNALICNAAGAGIPELRPEGLTELVGDVVITCTGGPGYAVGATIPTVNITLFTLPSVPVTSRLIGGGGASEALLLIDEPGSGITTGATGGYGTNAPQTLCTTAQQQAVGGSPCTAFVGKDTSGNYAVAVTAVNGTTPAANVYQGKLGDLGVTNSVSFYNVPVLPPSTQGVSRVFRITNVRVPVSGGNLSGTLSAYISTSSNQTLPVAGTAFNIGVVGPAMGAAVKLKNNPFQQCQPQTVMLSANLIFTEGFATGFKTRVVPGGAANLLPNNPTGNTTWAAEGLNLAAPSNQNIPGGLYGFFNGNTESGLILPSLSQTNTTTGLTYTAGLADYGTRLKAVFYNIPAGITLYVSTTSASVTATGFTPGGTALYPYAVLVATNSGEATPDGSAFTPITSSVAGHTLSSGVSVADGLTALALTANSTTGAATAVWEVTNSNPSAQDVLTFSVYVSYAPQIPTSSNIYGLPITDAPGELLNDVQMSMAPEPSQAAFAASAGPTALQYPVPRFNVVKTQEGRWTTINLCQTTLLYPYVIASGSFDTGIAVANTSWDPWGTPNQTGSCKLYGYGVSIAAAGNTAAQPVVSGCDFVQNPLAGTNCFPIVPTGQVMSIMAGSSPLANFQGYVIAVCNFQYAHGYAAVTDNGLRNLWSSYLALELYPAPSGVTVGTPGTSPRTGAAGIEALIH